MVIMVNLLLILVSDQLCQLKTNKIINNNILRATHELNTFSNELSFA
jgi:hypothetical protein